MMRHVELLAPAKDAVCGMAAIDCGADAVYIGAERFGAREKAGNSMEEIGKLCEYAHRYWARVYVTVNTVLRDEEIAEAVRVIWAAYEAGADGVIIQDTGLLECELPPLALIASTQMHNDTAAKVNFLSQCGFTRVILARELSIEEIAAVHAAAPEIELECFIHGALCVSYSGQCYLSYARGGRSGNRGACAQPCRLRYRLEDSRGKVLAGPAHLLSLKDLNLTQQLAALVAAGVSSFKIEGRLKERKYVMNTVAWYRARLDEVLVQTGGERSSSGASQTGFSADIHKTFNRGYTEYFAHGRHTGMSAWQSPKWMGEELGRVRRVQGNVIAFETNVDVANGDGISYFDERGEVRGARVNQVEDEHVMINAAPGLKAGMIVYRNHDQQWLRELERARSKRTIGVKFSIAAAGGNAQCTAHDEDGVSVEAPYQWDGKQVAGREEACERVKRQFEKCGGTEFRCEGVEYAGENIGVPAAAEMNRIRRDLCERLRARRAAQRPKMERRACDDTARYPVERLDMRGNVINKKAAAWYRRHGVREIASGGDVRASLEGEVVMTTRYCMLHELGLCTRAPGRNDVRRPLFLIDEDGTRLEVKCEPETCRLQYILHAAGKKRVKAQERMI